MKCVATFDDVDGGESDNLKTEYWKEKKEKILRKRKRERETLKKAQIRKTKNQEEKKKKIIKKKRQSQVKEEMENFPKITFHHLDSMVG